MANKRFGLGVLVMVLVFGMTVAGCDNDPGHGGRWDRIDETLPDVEMTGDWTALNVEFDGNVIELSRPSGTAGSLDGVWTGTFDGTSIVVTFTGTNWIARDTAGNNLARGTVTISGSNVSITITHLMDSGGNGGGTNIGGDDGNDPSLRDPTGVWDFIINDLPITLTIRGSTWIFDAGDSEFDFVGTVYYDFEPFHGTVITLRCFNTGTNIGYAKLTSATTMILDLVGHPAVAGTFYGTRSELGVFDRTWSRGSDRLVISGANYIFRQVRDGTLMDVSRGTFQDPSFLIFRGSGSFTINQTHLINYSTGQLELNSQSETGNITLLMGGHFQFRDFSSFPVNGFWHWRRN